MTAVIQGTRPLASLNGSIALTSGTAPGFVCQRLVLNIVTAASSISVTTLDGNTVSLGTLALGFYQLDIEFTSFTAGTPANVTAVGFYAIEG